MLILNKFNVETLFIWFGSEFHKMLALKKTEFNPNLIVFAVGIIN